MAGRKPLATLDAALADRFRSVAKQRIEAKGIDRGEIIKHSAHFPARSPRWLEGVLGPSGSLPIDHALEVAARLHRLKVRLPDQLLDELLANYRAPAILVFPGETQRLVATVLEQVKRIEDCGPRTLARLDRSLSKLFEQYERFNKTPLGREVVHRIQSQMQLGSSKNWKLNYMRYTQHVGVTGDSTAVPSLPSVVDSLVREHLARKPRKRAR